MAYTRNAPKTELKEKRSKYNASKAVLLPNGEIKAITIQEAKVHKELNDHRHGILFDSKDEARYYRDELLPKVEDGKISVRFQPKFTLIPKFEKEGVKHQAVTYTPDFEVTNLLTGRTYLVDVKGMEDQKFPIKRKLFDHSFPEYPPLIVMKYCKKFGGWITGEEYDRKKRAENRKKKAATSI